MSKPPKQPVHFAAFGYEPGRMKPIHLATGYFLAVTGFYFRLEWLNKAAVISHKDGFKGNYVSGALVDLLKADQRLGDRVDVAKLNFLRNQLNAVVDNDAAVFAAYGDYSTFGNDYTLSSQRFVTGHNRLDGYAGYFLKRVFERTEDGRVVLEFSRRWIEQTADPVERFVEPLLDSEDTAEGWNNQFPTKFGEFDDARLDRIASRMAAQTAACRLLCQNLNRSIRTQDASGFSSSPYRCGYSPIWSSRPQRLPVNQAT